MQKLKCELCNSVDIVKIAADMFQCQSCGCKYTLEQAKSIISGVVETTIGDTEFNRLVSNAKTQIKLGNDDALCTIDLIMKEYPNRYQGYWLFIQYFFSIIEKRKTIDFGYYPYKSKVDGLVHCVTLSACEKVYKDLLAVTEEDSGITREEVINYWESSIQKIAQGLINGTINGLIETRSGDNYQAHPLILNLHEEGKNNEKLLLKHNLCMHFVSQEECEWFLNFGKPAYSGTLWQPTFILDKKAVFFDSWGENLFYRMVKDGRSFYPIKDNIQEIIATAKANVNRAVFTDKKCPKCSKPLHKGLFGKMKCYDCDFSSSMIE